MAWRITHAVNRGEIDNSTEGHTSGRIWLLGRDEPLELTLQGDCLRDLAGMRVEFANPEPELEPTMLAEVSLTQRGVVGDITASRRTRGGYDPKWSPPEDGSDKRDSWRNTLYIEWFSEENGRVVIESDRFELTTSECCWRMDGDADQAQRLANLQAMRDHMTRVIRRREPREENVEEDASEYEWEERLKESDRLTDAYQEVLEKYMDEPDAEQKEAFVMGWDGLLGALADQHESDNGSARVEEPGFLDQDFLEDCEEGEEDSPFAPEEEAPHPLQEMAHELALRSFDLARREGPEGSPSSRLVSNLMQVSAKLAGALEGAGSGYEPETGYVLAILKRCLHWLNEAIAACLELVSSEEDPDHKRALESLQNGIFEVRDAIVELRRELKRG